MIRTKMSMTTETQDGQPVWGPNAVTTDVPLGQDEVAVENLIAGRTYYIKVWNEDEFGNRSPDTIRIVNTPMPTRLQPILFSAQGVLDEGSAMYAFVKVPSSVKTVEECWVTLAFRQFMAPAQSAATSSTLTAADGGGQTSGSSSSSSSNNSTLDIGLGTNFTSGSSGAASTGTAHTHSSGTYGDTSAFQTIDAHSHGISHTHSVANHTHSVGTHTHSLVYGTYEETYPASHNVYLDVYQRYDDAWTQRAHITTLTGDIEDIDLTAYITGPGDWRISVQSTTSQPNDGRLGCDLFGSMSVTI